MNPELQSRFVCPGSVFLSEFLSGLKSSFLGLDAFAFNAYKEFEVFKSFGQLINVSMFHDALHPLSLDYSQIPETGDTLGFLL